MAESFNKKDRVKKKRKKRLEKAEKMQQRKLEGKKEVEFMYVDENGNLTSTPPDPSKKTEINLEDIVIGGAVQKELDPEEITRFGVVKFFNDEKGYGFIVDDKSDESLFVHIEQLIDKVTERDKVTFEIGNGPKGPMAVMVKLVK